MDTIYKEALSVYTFLKEKYNDNDAEHCLAGKCIEASDLLAERLKDKGYKAQSKQCFVLYQNWEACSEICYEEHWYTEIKTPNGLICADPTMCQFKWAFEEELPDVYVGDKPPFYLDSEPDEQFLKDIGWNQYYETGTII